MNEKKYNIHKSKLRKRESSIIERNKVWFKEIESVIVDFEKANIPYSIIKGEALSIQAYGNVGFRSSADIDILIPKTYVQKSKQILLKNGYKDSIYDKSGNERSLTRMEEIMFNISHQVAPFYKKLIDPYKQMSIDINTDMFWGEYNGKRINIEHFLEDTVKTNIHSITVKTLPLIKAFIELCIHHYKEMHAIYYFKLGNPFTEMMFQDVSAFFKRHLKPEINQFEILVNEYEIQEIIYYILFYTNVVFPDKTMYHVMKRFESPKTIEKLNTYGLCESEIKKWPINFKNRMNHPNLYNVIKPYLTDADKKKIELVLSIFN